MRVWHSRHVYYSIPHMDFHYIHEKIIPDFQLEKIAYLELTGLTTSNDSTWLRLDIGFAT